MGSIDEKMNYGDMDAMISTCNQVASSLGDSMSAIKNMGGKLSEGFQGGAGDLMQQALNSILLKKMSKMQEKMVEMSKDLKDAMQDTKQGVSNSKSKYG